MTWASPAPSIPSLGPLCRGKATVTNHAGTMQHEGRKLFVPRNCQELRAVLANHRGQELTVLGTGHSHSLPDTRSYIAMGHMNQVLRLDRAVPSVTFEAGATLRAILEYLQAHGHTLHVAIEEQEQTLVGAVCTDAHGLGYRHTQLLAGVISMSLVDWDGKYRHYTDTDYDWVSIVSDPQRIGVIFEMTYRVEPSFWMSVAAEWRPAAALVQCLASPDHPRRLTAVLPTVPGAFTLQHYCCLQPRWHQCLANVLYGVYKCYRADLLRWVRHSPWLAWLVGRLAPKLPRLTAVASNTALLLTPQRTAGFGDVEFAVPVARAVDVFGAIRRALDPQPVVLYSLSSGTATPFPHSLTYRQDVTYINVRFEYDTMDFTVLDALIRQLNVPLHRAKYQPVGWTNPGPARGPRLSPNVPAA